MDLRRACGQLYASTAAITDNAWDGDRELRPTRRYGTHVIFRRLCGRGVQGRCWRGADSYSSELYQIFMSKVMNDAH